MSNISALPSLREREMDTAISILKDITKRIEADKEFVNISIIAVRPDGSYVTRGNTSGDQHQLAGILLEAAMETIKSTEVQE